MSKRKQPPAGSPPPVGLSCWSCGRRHFRVVYTRPRLNGVYRLRECLYCGKRFTTCERRLGA